jgi:integrase
VNVSELEDTDLVRDVLVQLTLKLDGTKASISTYKRKRATFFNALKYAVEKKHLAVNPLLIVSLPAAKSSDAIDRRRVVSEATGRRLLIAVGRQSAMGRHLQAFYGCLFFAGLRPGEAVSLTEGEIDLPEDEEEWGWFHLGHSSPEVRGAWTDSGEREIRQLKHRAVTETRPVPIPPVLGKLLRRHLREFGTAPDGRLFRGEDGGLVSESTTNRIWDCARADVLTRAETKSVLAERPYDLRHARLSIWLNAGVDPAQISEWAGNSVPVLLRVYIHCLSDSQEAALAKLGRKSTPKAEDADLSDLDRLLIGQDVPEPEPVSCYELALAYIGAKWDTIGPTTRKGALETLTKVTMALLDRVGPWPTDVQLVQALTSWAFRPDRWDSIPDEHAEVIAWVAERSPDARTLKDPERLGSVLAYLGRRLDGEPASPNVAARRRSVLFNLLEYAVRERHLPVNPLLFRSW